MAASVSKLETSLVLKPEPNADGEWGEEDYHDLPYGQLCLLSKEKTGGSKSKQEIRERRREWE